jgi:hypothetical protein
MHFYLLFTLFFISTPLWAGIEGHYLGTMDLTYDRPRKIDLELTLTLTGQTEIIQKGANQFEESQVIDSAFIIDDEGGPFSFTKVSYNLDRSELDLRYNRKVLTPQPYPSDFRLIGNLTPDGGVKGRVISGNRGPIGTFELKLIPARDLSPVKKYEGAWHGAAVMFHSGIRRAIDIVVGGALTETTTPPDFEFEFTPGKLGYFAWESEKFSFNNIVIDYLRQRIYLSDIDAQGRSVSSAVADVDFDRQTLRGSLEGVYRGKIADIILKKSW